MARPSLQRRIVAGLLGYMLLLAVVVIGFGYHVHETAEQHAWEAILRAELADYLQRSETDADYRWNDTETLALRVSAVDDAAAPFAGLADGVHDEVPWNGREHVVLIHHQGTQRLALSLDISDIEQRERGMVALMWVFAAVLVAVLSWGAVWLVRRLADPLGSLAGAITRLQPETTAARLALAPDASEELAVIVSALNGYLDRNDAFVKRERAFITTASHELRTPIAALQAQLENLVDGVAEPDPATFRVMLAQAERLGRLVTQLLDLSRLESGAVPLDRTEFRVEPLLALAVREHRLQGAAVAVTVDVEPTDLTADGDPERVHQVVANLLENAVRHSPAGGTVEVRARRGGEGVVIEVADEGPGIPEADASRVFERFYRADAARSSQAGGAGLGLAIARWIVDLHGGEIHPERREPHGCRMVVTLPTAA